jgi:hypothetical protein
MARCHIHGREIYPDGCRDCQNEEVNEQFDRDLARIDRELAADARIADERARLDDEERESFRYDACDRHLKMKRSCSDCRDGVAAYEREVEKRRLEAEVRQKQREAAEAERARERALERNAEEKRRARSAARKSLVRFAVVALAVGAFILAPRSNDEPVPVPHLIAHSPSPTPPSPKRERGILGEPKMNDLINDLAGAFVPRPPPRPAEGTVKVWARSEAAWVNARPMRAGDRSPWFEAMESIHFFVQGPGAQVIEPFPGNGSINRFVQPIDALAGSVRVFGKRPSGAEEFAKTTEAASPDAPARTAAPGPGADSEARGAELTAQGRIDADAREQAERQASLARANAESERLKGERLAREAEARRVAEDRAQADSEAALKRAALAREEANRRAARGKLLALLRSTEMLTGSQSEGRTRWTCRFRATTVDEPSGTLVGELHWTGLGAVTRVRGTIVEGGIEFEEVAFIRRGDVALGSVYKLRLDDSGVLTGTWRLGYRRGGMSLTR